MPPKSRPMPRIALRLTLLVLWIVLANAWVLLQFGIEISSVFFIQLFIGVAAFLMKALTPQDNKAVHDELRNVFYRLLRWPVLIPAYIVLLALTLTFSTVVVSGENASKTCIKRGENGCAKALVDEDKKAIFLARVGGNRTAQLEDSEPKTFPHWPWVPSTLTTSAFGFPPAVLLRVPYEAQFSLAGGQIEVRDAKTQQLLATQKTSVDSASMLLGRQMAIPAATVATWDGRGKARERWSKFTPREDVKVAEKQELEVLFRTRSQKVTARRTYTVAGGNTLQDVMITKVTQ